MSEHPISKSTNEETEPLKIPTNRTLNTEILEDNITPQSTEEDATKILEEPVAIKTVTTDTTEEIDEITDASPTTPDDYSTETEPLNIGTPKTYIDGLPNVEIPLSPTASQFSDDQIDDLLKEVAEIKKNSPPKPSLSTSTSTNLPTAPAPKTPSPVKSSNTVTLSPIPTRSNTPTEDLSKLRINKSTSRNTTTLPTSVSQALFSKTVKVMKVHDKNPAPKFVGMKSPATAEQTAKIETLQSRDYELTAKIKKVEREISYLNDLIDSASITSNLEELRKLKFAIKRLEDYLDVKIKEKYEVGMSLTRALRRRVASGEIAEFWSSGN
ncbi:hypothetical protein WICPIJ_003365 [Wickerhamomyces pijperi]|uniref:Uncharacterized protein n=1 Tax=Wickerhamomyces pijperi TaxID=599730 RepID=A0A9P8TNS8_WICPI|nr:hypothetical protein WICPIJ_003365 [Wickerhamomyces pijperi]